MYRPVTYRSRLFDDFWDLPFPDVRKSFIAKNSTSLMKTDVKENENGYELSVELPGYNKEELNLSLEKGVLTIAAAHSEDKEEKSGNGSYIRRERYCGSASRSFFVGEVLTEEDIHARYENGLMIIDFPKASAKEAETRKFIAIA